MAKILSLAALFGTFACLVSCETPTRPVSSASVAASRYLNVRTTAYTHSEGSSGNALGRRLSGGGIMSASADWSRFPVGTRFRVVPTGETYVIDDYGWALVGTGTIDLYKPSRSAVRRWGVRRVDIEILHQGSDDESLQVLRSRRGIRNVRRMIASIESKRQE
jgi:3D (Asp-Asp-Asp) domain-containing protein